MSAEAYGRRTCLEEGCGAYVVGLSTRHLAAGVAVLVVVFAGIAPGRAIAAPPQVLFDDFNYQGYNALFTFWRHGWRVRTAQGWLGIPEAGLVTGGDLVRGSRQPAPAPDLLDRRDGHRHDPSAGLPAAQVLPGNLRDKSPIQRRTRLGP